MAACADKTPNFLYWSYVYKHSIETQLINLNCTKSIYNMIFSFEKDNPINSINLFLSQNSLEKLPKLSYSQCHF